MAPGSDQAARSLLSPFVQELAWIVRDSHVIDDDALMEPYCVDWTRRFGGPALCVVRPGSTQEVAAVVKACAAAKVPIVAQGGNTGLVGGSVPAAAGAAGGFSGLGQFAGFTVPPVIVSTQRLSWVDPVDQLSGQVTVGAGSTLGDVQRHAQAAGWEYGVDLGARDSATIGGTVATNAGGIRVLVYGMTRAQLTGIEAVLPDGSVISHLAGLAKDNTGFDLAQLLCGSEGTLAIITAVRLRLHRPHERTSIALIGCSDYDDALTVINSAVTGNLVAAEAIDDVGMQLIESALDLAYPLAEQHPLVALVEVADGGTGDGFHGELFEGRDVVVGLESRDVERLWEYRERQAEAFATLGVIHKLDVSVPLSALTECTREIRQIAENLGVETVGIFGHIADGNVHVQLAGVSEDDAVAADKAILECVARFNGSISAEHGIGRAKSAYLELSRSPAEIAAMRALKDAWDPHGRMNPGVLFGQ